MRNSVWKVGKTWGTGKVKWQITRKVEMKCDNDNNDDSDNNKTWV
jgi:hypothetical protein